MNILHVGWAPTTDEWQALEAVGTLIVTVFAALCARQQVAESRQARDEHSMSSVPGESVGSVAAIPGFG